MKVRISVEGQDILYRRATAISVQQFPTALYRKGDIAIIHFDAAGMVDVARIPKGWQAILIKPEE